jgi:L-alanine-DL-glutamate epimerase-like enolase superfamily enzyme
MKIVNVDTICLSRLHERENMWVTARYRTIKADCAIVVITTDEGATGIGEACPYGVPSLITDWVAWLSPGLIGQDPTDFRIVPAPRGTSHTVDCAVAGIDTALWDLRGQIADRRLSALLNPSALEKVRLYASSGCRYDWRDRPEQLIEETLSYAARGFTACKVRIGTDWAWDGVTPDRFLGLMRELTQAVGGRMELMLDGNQRLTEDQALTIAREIEQLGFTWFEEPIPKADIDGYVRLNAAVTMAITGGEGFTTLEQFRPYLERHAYDIVQPDVAICGISEAMRIAAAACRYGIDVCPHSWHNGLMAMANAHYVAALPSPRVLELCMIQGPLQWEILAQPPIMRDGWLELPARPGIGVTVAEGIAQRYPYVEGHYAVDVVR